MKPLLLLLFFSVACTRASTSSLDPVECWEAAVPRTLVRLRQLGVDSVLTFHYDYDNGSLPEAVTYVVWHQAGHSHMQAYRGCDTLSLPTAHTRSVDTLFTFYQQQRLDTMSAQIPTTSSRASHGLGYTIAVYLPQGRKYYVVRDDQRPWEKPQETLPGEVPSLPQKDPRSRWLDLLEQLVH
jgi:hypothetical protein